MYKRVYDGLFGSEVDTRIRSRLNIDENGCHIWTGATAGGYGQIRWKGRRRGVHRLLYEIETGRPVPPGLELDHLCRVRLCCNTEHLEPVTRSENEKRAYAARKT